VGSLGAERRSAATVARPNGYALDDVAGDGGMRKGSIEACLLPLLGSMPAYRRNSEKE
jgi:hypothetical protein